MIFDDEMKEKLEILDRLISNIEMDDLKKLAEEYELKYKLAGTWGNKAALTTIGSEMTNLVAENLRLNSRLESVEYDMNVIIKTLNQRLFTQVYDSEFNLLKNRHGIY